METTISGSVDKRLKIMECKLNKQADILKELQIIVALACIVVCLST